MNSIQETFNARFDRMTTARGMINKIRAPQPDKEEKNKEVLARLEQLRGRPNFLPYIGSGLGNGAYVELLDGSWKLDLINGIGVHLFGHSHPALVEAMVEGALEDVVMQGNLQPSKTYVELLDQLVTLGGKSSKLKHGWIGTCGTMMNENALKIARQKNSPARKIVSFKDAFAGRSTLMAEITDNPDYRVGLPAYDEVLFLPFYDAKDPNSTEKMLSTFKKFLAENPGNISCLAAELVQGEGGFNTAPREFFIPLFEECKKNNIAIWIDEVQSFGRTGELFAFETLKLGEYVDIVTVAKTIQCGAILYTAEYNPKPGLVAGTFTGSSAALSAGKKTLEMLTDGTFLGENGKVQKIHHEFVGMLNSLKLGSCKDQIDEVGGIGLMVSMTPYKGDKTKVTSVVNQLFQAGIVAGACGHGPYRVRFLLPLVLTSEQIAEARPIIESVLLKSSV